MFLDSVLRYLFIDFCFFFFLIPFTQLLGAKVNYIIFEFLTRFIIYSESFKINNEMNFNKKKKLTYKCIYLGRKE